MPVKFVEEVEDALKRAIGDLDRRILALQKMHIEEAAIEIGNFAQQLLHRG